MTDPIDHDDCVTRCFRCDCILAMSDACEECADKYEECTRRGDENWCECCFDDMFVPWPTAARTQEQKDREGDERRDAAKDERMEKRARESYGESLGDQL